MASPVADFREKLKGSAPIPVTIPGTDLVIDCRRPDLVDMVASGYLVWPALRRVQEVIATNRAERDTVTVVEGRPEVTVIEKAQAMVDFLAELVCAAAVAPRVVMTAAEVTDDSICVADIPYAGRMAIMNATMPSPTPAPVAEFRGDESARAAPGPDGAAVRDEAVDALANA